MPSYTENYFITSQLRYFSVGIQEALKLLVILIIKHQVLLNKSCLNLSLVENDGIEQKKINETKDRIIK